jgi:crotonobetainyl-CoA:carnitine CoA-transferase CaiB-like acyl-CoA transferase
MTGVLGNLTVLDLSQGISGPMTGMLLSDQGARVIKVEPAGGDPSRSLPGARVWNRGKQSIILDLESATARDVFLKLARRADVVIESPWPGNASSLGLGYDRLRRENPRLIHCSITGYGDLSGHAGRPAIDALVAARTGLQWEKRGWPGGSIEHVNGVEPFLPDLDLDPSRLQGPARPGPLFSAIPWPSLSAFYLASVGISAALHARERTGVGQQVSTSLFQGALVNGTLTWQRVERPNRPGYRMWMTDPRAPHGFYQTADHRWVQNWTPQPGFVLGVSGGERLELNAGARALRDDDTRVGMDPEDLLVLLEYDQPMADAFRRFTAAEWERVAAEGGVSIQTIRSPEEALQSDGLLEDGCVVEVDDPELGPIRHVGLTYHLHAAPGRVTAGSPLPDQHAGQILAELFGTEQAAAEPAEPAGDAADLSRGPLTGIVVLDLGLAVAGPFGTQMLADLGADVIKINRKTDAAWRDLYIAMCCNRGKRSITLDLKSSEGLTVFHELVRRADVVHTNMHWDSVQKLGADYESLRRLNPRLIYCHTRGFENGPRILLPGHDQSGAAVAGVAWEEGGLSDGGKPIWPNISLGDTGTGLLSANAVIQALYHRDRTGEGQFVDTSIAYVQLLNASSAWIGAEGVQVPARPRLDAMQMGLSALYRLYETSAGWLCIAVQAEGDWGALCKALGRGLESDPRFATPGERAAHDAELIDVLTAAFAQRSAKEWFEILDGEGVPAEISSDTFALELFDDAELIDKGIVVAHDHPLAGKLEMFGRLIDFSRTPAVIDRAPLVPGQESREILAGAGFATAAIDALISAGVVLEAE